jgi:hypothetical protein
MMASKEQNHKEQGYVYVPMYVKARMLPKLILILDLVSNFVSPGVSGIPISLA